VKATDGKDYYGILQDMIKLCYVGDSRPYLTILFKCDWFDSIHGVSVHETYKLVDVNHTKRYPHLSLLVKSRKFVICHLRRLKLGEKIGGQF